MVMCMTNSNLDILEFKGFTLMDFHTSGRGFEFRQTGI